MTIKKENRLPKHKDCKHDWRFLGRRFGVDAYYCTKCLINTFKLFDFSDEQIQKLTKEHYG